MDYYNDEPEPAPSVPKKAPAQDEASKTTVIPKSLAGDAEPGDTVELRVVRVHGDSVEVELAETEAPEEEGQEEMPMGQESGMNMMED